jgi:hypothetical protein
MNLTGHARLRHFADGETSPDFAQYDQNESGQFALEGKWGIDRRFMHRYRTGANSAANEMWLPGRISDLRSVNQPIT